NTISAVADKLAPASVVFRHRRLFTERDFELFEEKSNYQDQQKLLEERRQKAVNEIYGSGGTKSVVEFAKGVESAWRVGFAFGMIAEDSVDNELLPGLLESTDASVARFAGGF